MPPPRCPKCGKGELRDYVRHEVDAPTPPSKPLVIPPKPLLIAAIVLQLLSSMTFASNWKYPGAIFGIIGVVASIVACAVIIDDRAKAKGNYFCAKKHALSHREIRSVLDGLRTNFNDLVNDYHVQLRDHFVRQQAILEDEFASNQARLSANYETKFEALRIRDAEVTRREKHVSFRQSEIEAVLARLGKRLLDDSVKFIANKLTADNFVTSRERLIKLIDFCRKHGFYVSPNDEQRLVSDLRKQFELAVRRQYEREEQARIRAQIREEEQTKAEYAKELKRLEDQRDAIRKALDKALKDSTNQHSAEIEELKQRLVEAEERTRRTQSMAELTKAGFVYVLSNIGAFGESVFKVGMTRRLKPEERVSELSGASVPFPFDVHMMISCDNAPKLENTLHKALDRYRLNRVNLRKEFFRTDIETIRSVVEANHGVVEYVADAEALQFNESIALSDEELDMIHQVMAAVESEHGSDYEED